MKMLTAFTLDIDDPQDAVEELLAQLDLEGNHVENAVGIVTCHSDFIDSGVVAALGEALPFELVGCTTLGSAGKDVADMMSLTLSVLYGDGVVLHTEHSGSLIADLDTEMDQMFRRARAKMDEAPVMAFAFFPMLQNIGAEPMILALDKAVHGKTPIFGTLACDQSTGGFERVCTIHNGETLHEGAALLLIGGDFDPTFFVAAVSDNKIQHQKGIVTEADGSVLKTVNDQNFLEYMNSLGLMAGGNLNERLSIPLLLDYMDGTKPVARAMYAVTPEGYVVCGSNIPKDATLSVGTIDRQDVLDTTGETAREMLATGKRNGAFMFPCLSRNLMLGMDILAEMNTVQEVLGDQLPYQLCYSGGELCPVYDSEGSPVNRFHNFSFVGCIF